MPPNGSAPTPARELQAPRRPRFLRGRVTMRLLVTRPEPDNERTAAALRAQRARRHAGAAAPHRTGRRRRSRRGAVGRDPVDQRQRRPRGCEPSRRGELRRACRCLRSGRSSADAARAAGFADVDIGRWRRGATWRGSPPSASPVAPAAALSRRRGPRPAILRASLRRTACRVRTVVVYRPPRRRSFRPRSARRWSRAGSTACCISPAAASKAISLAAAT